ncbi:hypothetical protein M569_15012, partial [Genlisea aurea]
MALKSVLVSDVPNLDASFYSPSFTGGMEIRLKEPKFLVIGHRGRGMNVLHSSDLKFKTVKENTILSFNSAGAFGVDFVEFDVQVTSDGCPIIFHDNFIYSRDDNGTIHEKRVTELSLPEFLGYGPGREQHPDGKKLLRKTKDGKIVDWCVETDDCACTLEEAFDKVKPSVGFNIELKLDDHIIYPQHILIDVMGAILKVVSDHSNGRPIIFSTFHPDAALLIKKLQASYPVFFLTNGGNETYQDERRNSLEAAVKLCVEGGLQGIVSEVSAVIKNPGQIKEIKELGLSLLTYGKLNDVGEVVYVQYLLGVDGVIVDLVEEITGVVKRMVKGEEEDEEEGVGKRPKFSDSELAFLLNLVSKLI